MPLIPTIPAVDFANYACNVQVAGQPLSDTFQLISVQVKQAYQFITSATLLLKQPVGFGDSPVPSLTGADLPVSGQPIIVKATLDADEIILFDGVIVRHKYKTSTTGTRLQITAKTKAVNISLNTQAETFAKQTDKEIIESLITKQGCSLTLSNITSQFTMKHTQLVKNGLNDWDFANVRAEANGCFLYTEKDVVILEKPMQQFDPLKVITATYGDNVFELEIEQDERKNAIENELISFNLSSFENDVTTEEEASTTSSSIKGKNNGINYRTYNDLESTDLVNATSQLKTLSAHNGLAHIKANLQVKPGFTLKVDGFNDLVNGDYVITSVMQDYSDGGYSTYLQFGLNHTSYVSKYNLQPLTHTPVLLNAIVTALESDPDNLYRIQVKIAAWQDAQEPVWARLSTLYAGDQYGLVLLPEVGDEVIVAFMGGDFDVPVVLGSAFSPKLPPHTAFTDDNYKKILVTKKGMKWAWDDKKNIHEISTPNGNKILISEEDHSITITDENTNKIEMNDSAINLTGSKDVNIKAATNLKLEGGVVDISASGNLTIKGNMVLIN